MAEVLGVAASGIAIAQISLQVGGAVRKLKQLWNEVKDVPDDIADLMEHIDCLSLAVWESENNIEQNSLPSIVWDDSASKLASTYCRKALRNLTTMIDELNLQIDNAKKGRRKIAAFQVLLKKDLLKKLEKRLENAIRTLSLAQQSYLIALTRVQPNIIVERLDALISAASQTQVQLNSKSQSDTEEGQLNSNRRQKSLEVASTATPSCLAFTDFTKTGIFGKILVNTSSSGRSILFQAPRWLSWRSWELHSAKATGAWQFYLRSYSTICFPSKILCIARDGCVEDMQKLFDTGLASPYDRNPNGFTLLHYAVNYLNYEVMKYLLIKIGLDPFHQDVCGKYPSDDISPVLDSQGFRKFVLSDKEFAKKLLVFSKLDYSDDDTGMTQISHTECNCHLGINNVELYKELLPYQCPLHATTSFKSRVEAASAALVSHTINIEVIRLILGPEWSTNNQALRSNIPNTLLAASAAFRLCDACMYSESRCWFWFAVDVVKHTPDFPTRLTCEEASIHYLWGLEDSWSPLMFLVGWFTTRNQYFYMDLRYSFMVFSRVLVVWLEVVKLAGIDLDVYGRCEHELFITSTRRFNIIYNPWEIWGLPFSELYLIGFKFGPEPKDWDFYWAEPTDEFAGDFWDMVENPPPHIPGSWVD